MSHSTRLGLPFLAPSQAQKHVTVNEAIGHLDEIVQLRVVSRGAALQPVSPKEADAYILPATPGGDQWAGMTANNIAAYRDGFWREIAVVEGMRAYVSDETSLCVYNGSSWVPVSSGSSAESVARFGVNATADTVNRLAVNADAVLFSYDASGTGTGDVRIVINKEASTNIGSQIFQSGASGRAEIGLVSDDKLQIKLSADGTNWEQAMTFDPATQYVGFGVAQPSHRLDVNGPIRLRGPGGVTQSGELHLYFANENNRATIKTDNSGAIHFLTGIAGVASRAMISNTGGLTVGTPVGGNKGDGTVNAQAVYDDNALLSCYVFDQAVDGHIDKGKWHAKVLSGSPDQSADVGGNELPRVQKSVGVHEPMEKFAARIGTDFDPLTLDGYAAHWRDKRHLTSMPNEATYDVEQGMPAGAWVQRLVETVEIHAVLIEQLNQLCKALGARMDRGSSRDKQRGRDTDERAT